MKVLVLGHWGREHALVWALCNSPLVTKIWCTGSNPGIAMESLVSNGSFVECVELPFTDLRNMLGFALRAKPDLIVVGPDSLLAVGVVDLFQKAGLKIWGPNQNAAKFEWSKCFAHEFMERHGIPHPRGGIFSTREDAKAFAKTLDGDCVVKTDGLCRGKGVDVCRFFEDACESIEDKLGHGEGRILIQERLNVEYSEISTHYLTDGLATIEFPASQDHKRLLTNDQGFMTGGMGVYTPVPLADEFMMSRIRNEIIIPWKLGCEKEGIDYRGMLYPGIIVTPEGPKVIEFNARFGDPEAQAYLVRLGSDLFPLLDHSASTSSGVLKFATLEQKPEAVASVCVVLASAKYPQSMGKRDLGDVIHGLDEVSKMDRVKVFHASTKQVGRSIVTNGGRVLSVTAWGSDLLSAQNRVYEAVAQISFRGMQYRKDIGAKGLASLE